MPHPSQVAKASFGFVWTLRVYGGKLPAVINPYGSLDLTYVLGPMSRSKSGSSWRQWIGRPGFSPIGAVFVCLFVPYLSLRTGEAWLYLRFFGALALTVLLPGYAIGRSTGVIRARHANWERLTAAMALGTGVTVLWLFVLSFVGVPRLPIILAVYLGVMALAAGRFLAEDVGRAAKASSLLRSSVETKTLWLGGGLVWAILLALLFIILFPTRGLLVSPGHDPVQNSLMAHRLVAGDFLHTSLPKFSLWYPPGGAYLAGLLSWVSGIQSAKVVLIQTNVYNAMIAGSVALFMVRWLGSRLAGFVGFVTYGTLSAAIASYFIVCGKNSQVIGDFLFFYCGALSLDAVRRRDLKFKFVFMAMLAGSVIVHFSLAFLLPGFVALLVLRETLSHWGRLRSMAVGRLRNYRGWLLAASVCGIPLLFQALVLRSDPFLGKTMIASVEESGQGSKLFDFDLINFAVLNHEIYVEMAFLRYLAAFGISLSVLLMAYGLMSCRWRQRKSTWDVVVLVGLPVFILFLMGLTNSFVKRYASLYLFAPVALGAGYGVFHICRWVAGAGPTGWRRRPWWPLMPLMPLIPLLVLGVFNLNDRHLFFYRPKTFFEAADLKAFEWIRRNIPANEYFLPASTGTIDMRFGENVTVDSILYIKQFAEREDVIGFVGGDRFDHVELGYRALYLKLLKNLRDLEVLRQFVKDDIKYVFSGSQTNQYAATNPEDFSRYPDLYHPIYQDGRIRVYRITLSDVGD